MRGVPGAFFGLVVQFQGLIDTEKSPASGVVIQKIKAQALGGHSTCSWSGDIHTRIDPMHSKS